MCLPFRAGSCHASSVRLRLLILVAIPVTVATGCGSHSVANQSSAAMAAEAQCQSHFDRQFLFFFGSKVPSEGLVHDLSNGRLHVTSRVPVRAGLIHPESYTCVVARDSSGLHIVRFDVKRAP